MHCDLTAKKCYNASRRGLRCATPLGPFCAAALDPRGLRQVPDPIRLQPPARARPPTANLTASATVRHPTRVRGVGPRQVLAGPAPTRSATGQDRRGCAKGPGNTGVCGQGGHLRGLHNRPGLPGREAGRPALARASQEQPLLAVPGRLGLREGSGEHRAPAHEHDLRRLASQSGVPRGLPHHPEAFCSFSRQPPRRDDPGDHLRPWQALR